jgi:hypothetical protein
MSPAAFSRAVCSRWCASPASRCVRSALTSLTWLISDVDYTPAPLVPATDPETGTPLDLTYATLRSVSPIHVE